VIINLGGHLIVNLLKEIWRGKIEEIQKRTVARQNEREQASLEAAQKIIDDMENAEWRKERGYKPRI